MLHPSFVWEADTASANIWHDFNVEEGAISMLNEVQLLKMKMATLAFVWEADTPPEKQSIKVAIKDSMVWHCIMWYG